MTNEKNNKTESPPKAAALVRPDGRTPTQLRPMSAKVGVIDSADGSASFTAGKTIAIAAVYGPREMHPAHKKDSTKGVLRCTYNMNSFSVNDRIRPGLSRRSREISEITRWALEPVVMLKGFPGQVIDVHINIFQADAGTRCAGINAAAMALAHAGIPMKNIVSSVALGKLDKELVIDLDKEEEDFEEGEGSTDIPITLTPEGNITHLQLDGKISPSQLKEGIELAKVAAREIYEVQSKALKDSVSLEISPEVKG